MEEKQTLPQPQNALPPKITKEDFNTESHKAKVLAWTKSLIYVVVSSFLLSFAAYSLILPNNFTIGGVSGIGILLNVTLGVPQSLTMLLVNAPLVAAAFFFVKKKFALLTAVHIGAQTLWLVLLENFFPDFQILFEQNGEKIFAAIAAGLCIGVAIALAFKAGGSTGGADVVAVMIQKKIAAGSIAWMLFAINCTVVGASFFVFYNAQQSIAYNLLPIMMSAFESYIESKTNEAMTNGFQSAREFRIITDKPEEMAKAVMHELSRGVTALPATGMYTGETHTMLLCVVGKRQVVALRKIMKRVDPDSFAVMSNAAQVLGLGFYNSDV